MATSNTTTVAVGRGKPTPEQVDSIPTRIAQAQGIAQGTSQAALGQINALLTQAEGPALVASDAIQTIMEDAMTNAKQVADATVQLVIAEIENLLAPLQQEAQAYLAAGVRRRCRSSSTGSGAAQGAPVPSPPAPPTPGNAIPTPVLNGSGNVLNVTPGQPLPPAVVVWSVFYNCVTGQLAGVPNISPADRTALLSQGWNPVYPPGSITASDAASVVNYLNSIAANVRQMCSAPRGALPGILPVN